MIFFRNSGSFAGRKLDIDICRKISISHECLHLWVHVRILAMAPVGKTYRLDGTKWNQPTTGICWTGSYLGESIYQGIIISFILYSY